MHRFTCVLADPLGLHARPVARIAFEASRWRSAIEVGTAGRTASARDMVALMALDAPCGARLRVSVSGPDECEAAHAIGDVMAGL